MKLPLSKILAIPVVLGLAVSLYLTFTVDENYSWSIAPFVLGLVALYFFQPAIDWWWYQKYPPDVEEPLKRLFDKNLPYYRNLSEELKQKFRTRVALYIEANDFRPQVMEELPEDVKGVIASNIVMMTMGQEDYRLPAFERIVIYPGKFPSPQHLKIFHASEIYEEDGVLMFAMDHLMPGTLQATQYFNIGLYEYAKVFKLSHPSLSYPDLEEETWTDFEKVSRIAKSKIEKFVGLPDLDIWAVGVALFFTFPEKFKEINPSLYQHYINIFNQDPSLKGNPIIAALPTEDRKF